MGSTIWFCVRVCGWSSFFFGRSSRSFGLNLQPSSLKRKHCSTSWAWLLQILQRHSVKTRMFIPINASLRSHLTTSFLKSSQPSASCVGILRKTCTIAAFEFFLVFPCVTETLSDSRTSSTISLSVRCSYSGMSALLIVFLMLSFRFASSNRALRWRLIRTGSWDSRLWGRQLRVRDIAYRLTNEGHNFALRLSCLLLRWSSCPREPYQYRT